jgi:hypothetical protein
LVVDPVPVLRARDDLAARTVTMGDRELIPIGTLDAAVVVKITGAVLTTDIPHGDLRSRVVQVGLDLG